MFHVENNGSLLNVIFNGRIVISHSPEAPFAWAGKGKRQIDGTFVSDKIIEKSYLTKAEYDSKRNLLRLSGGSFSLSLHLKEEDGLLILQPRRSTTGLNRLMLSFPAIPESPVYGGGAQYRSLDLKGRRIPLWVRRHGRLSAISFKGYRAAASSFPVPVFFTKDCQWYYFDCQALMAFDFRRPDIHKVEFCNLPSSVSIGIGNNLGEVVSAISRVGGGQMPLPKWIHTGACIEVCGGTEAMSDALEKADNAGADISSICIKDWSGSHTTSSGERPFFDWIWNMDRYPKLDYEIAKLAERNIHVMAYINPHLSIEGSLYAEASMRGYLIKKPQGGFYVNDMGGFMAGHLDLTNNEACVWYKRIIKENILKLGFSGYMADMGDYLPPDAVLHSGENPLRIHNRWASKWTELNCEVVNEADGNAAFFTRCGWDSSQTMFVNTAEYHAGCLTGWNSFTGLRAALNASLSLSCSGICVSQSDCGGDTSYVFRRSKELFWRWMDYCAFTPIFRMAMGGKHGWHLDSDKGESLSHFSRMSRIHSLLSPYILDSINKDPYYPVMRPLFMCCPEDEALNKLCDSYMLGSELLVSPVFNSKENMHKVILPDGLWIDPWTGKEYSQGTHMVPAVFGKTPVFYSKNGNHRQLFKALGAIR